MPITNLVQNPFPVLRETLDLGEYHEDLAGNTVEVWLNPSQAYYKRWRDFHDRVKDLQSQDFDLVPQDVRDERARLWADLWGIPEDDAAALFENPQADNLVTWMCDQTWGRINSYALRRKKAASG